MRYIEGNHSDAETSGEINIIDTGANNTINPYILQIISVLTNPRNIPVLVIPDTLLAIGVLANLLLIYYILRHKRHQSSIFALILCLALCDLHTCSASIFVDNVISSLVKPGYLCPIAIFYLYTSAVTTSCHLVAIAIIRFYQLVYPLSARVRVTPHLCFKMSFIIWTLAMAYGIPFARYFLWVVATYNGSSVSICLYTGDPAFRKAAATVVMFSVTFLTIVFLAAKYCIVLQQSVSTQVDSSVSGQERKRQTTDTRALMTVIALSIICNLPSIIHRSMHGIFQVPYFPSHFYIMTILDKISFANFIFNPFVYAFASQSVRADLKAMLLN